MKRLSVLAYGVVSYAAFLGSFLYAIGFVGDFLVPKSIDSAPDGPIGLALAVNAALLLVFALQHSVMARPAFKRWWTRFVPEPIERSTYVLLASLALCLLYWQWRPMGGVIWTVESTAGQLALYSLCAAGWLTVLVATFLINHFDLFGLRQVWLYWRGKPYTDLPFRTPGLYRFVRHPLYVGFLMGFWATPTMTVAHLLFALGTTGYILIAIQLEERDLISFLGDDYAEYRRRVPMLIPGLPGKKKALETASATSQVA